MKPFSLEQELTSDLECTLDYCRREIADGANDAGELQRIVDKIERILSERRAEREVA